MDWVENLNCIRDNGQLLIESIYDYDPSHSSLELVCPKCHAMVFLPNVADSLISKLFETKPKYFSSTLIEKINKVKGEDNVTI